MAGYPKIYGFSGKSGSGKDYVASLFERSLKKRLGPNDKVLLLAFSNPSKLLCAARYGLSYDDLYGKKTDETRGMLQSMCDEARRDYSDMYFVNALKFEAEKHYRRSGVNIVIIPDVRFPEEVEMIRGIGGYVFRIEAPERSKENFLRECRYDEDLYDQRSSHNSEVALDPYLDDERYFTKILRNEVADDINSQVADILEEFPLNAMPSESSESLEEFPSNAMPSESSESLKKFPSNAMPSESSESLESSS